MPARYSAANSYIGRPTAKKKKTQLAINAAVLGLVKQ